MAGSGDRPLPQGKAAIVSGHFMGNEDSQAILLKLLLHRRQQNLILKDAAGENDLGELVLVGQVSCELGDRGSQSQMESCGNGRTLCALLKIFQ